MVTVVLQISFRVSDTVCNTDEGAQQQEGTIQKKRKRLKGHYHQEPQNDLHLRPTPLFFSSTFNINSSSSSLLLLTIMTLLSISIIRGQLQLHVILNPVHMTLMHADIFIVKSLYMISDQWPYGPAGELQDSEWQTVVNAERFISNGGGFSGS